MTLEDVGILMRADIQAWLTVNREADPVELAMSNKRNGDIPPIVYSQLKILQKAEDKLPRWVTHACIIPPRAFEQSTSERAAALKPWAGKRCLDLTCGLGVDTACFAAHFTDVTALEPDPVLAAAVRYNFHQLGLSRVRLHETTAENFLAGYAGPPFDLIYADPDRRDEQGQRQHHPGKGKPDVQALLPRLREIGKRLVIKASPLYDIAAAQRDFPEAERLILLSVDGEVKELLVEIPLEDHPEALPARVVWCDRQGEVQRFEFVDSDLPAPLSDRLPEPGTYLLEPDPAFYASRTADRLAPRYYPEIQAHMNQKGGYYFADNYTKTFPGRVFAIREVLPYKPKMLRKRFKQAPCLIGRRHFPFSVKKIRQATAIADGGTQFLLFTSFGDNLVSLLCDRV